MLVSISIAQDQSSPTQTVWGCILRYDGLASCIFYGPGTKPGGRIYPHPSNNYINKRYAAKIKKGYTELVSEIFDTTAIGENISLEEIASGVLSKIRFLPGDVVSQHPASAMNYIASLKAQSPSLLRDRRQREANEAASQISGPSWIF